MGTIELYSGKTATIDVEVNISLLEIWCKRFPHLCARVQPLHVFPYFLANATRLNPVLHIKKIQVIVLCGLIYNNNYASDDIPIINGFISSRTFFIK